MQMAGEQRIAAPRERVWEALNDPAVLAAAIPGCQTLEKVGDDRFTATVEVRIGPIGARFKGGVQLADLDPARGYTLVGEGNAGIAGSASGSARVRLADDDSGGTLVAYDVDAEVAGRLAQLGGPIIDATAKQLSAKFFTRFGEVVSGAEAQPAALTPSAAGAGAAAAAAPIGQVFRPPSPAPAPAGFPWSWVVALALAILAGFLLGRSDAADWWMVAVAVLVVVATSAGYAAGRGGGPAR